MRRYKTVKVSAKNKITLYKLTLQRTSLRGTLVGLLPPLVVSARSSGRLLLQRTNAPCHLPRFHENSSSVVSSRRVGHHRHDGHSLTPWISTPPADKDRKGNNVTSRHVTSRRVASRLVSLCCVVRSRAMTTHK